MTVTRSICLCKGAPRDPGTYFTVKLLTLDDPLLDAAAELDTTVLRTLDAIHLTAAYGLGDRLGTLVTYDARMTRATAVLQLAVASPQ